MKRLKYWKYSSPVFDQREEYKYSNSKQSKFVERITELSPLCRISENKLSGLQHNISPGPDNLHLPLIRDE